ncbi:MAG: Lyzozyme [Cyanobacteria bacterium RYN_339]|nr:Lyzozyme [Cyanobacteria bacterium RYN_339]
MSGIDAFRLVRFGSVQAPAPLPYAANPQQELANLQQQAQTYLDSLAISPAAIQPAAVAPVALPPMPPPPPMPPIPPPPPPLPPLPPVPPSALPYVAPAAIYQPNVPAYQPAVPPYQPNVPAYQPADPASTPALLAQLQGMIDNLRRQIQALTAGPASVPQPGVVPAPAPVGPTPAPAPGYGQPWTPGPGQLKGADTAHWQSDATFQSAIKDAQWSAIKATQGTRYVDPTFRARWDLLGNKIASGEMALRVAYLFLDPGNGTGQAQHFLDTLNIHGQLQPGTRLALDWETAALKSPQTLRDAAVYIHQVTGLWPLIYVQASKLAAAKAAVPEAPIWEAAWSSGIKTDVPFFQYSNGPNYDHDVFNGDLAALKRFAGWA